MYNTNRAIVWAKYQMILLHTFCRRQMFQIFMLMSVGAPFLCCYMCVQWHFIYFFLSLCLCLCVQVKWLMRAVFRRQFVDVQTTANKNRTFSL